MCNDLVEIVEDRYVRLPEEREGGRGSVFFSHRFIPSTVCTSLSVMAEMKNGVCVVQGEVALLLSAMRRSSRWTGHARSVSERRGRGGVHTWGAIGYIRGKN